MAKFTYSCIDAHTAGNPVRVVTSNHPVLKGDNMSEKRQYFINNYDWIRRALMFEPHGHALMSGSFLYPPTREDCDIAVLFIETSGCLPMCGHGTIGTVTIAIENGLVTPGKPGFLALETPAGKVEVNYTMENDKVSSVRFTNVPSYLAAENLKVESPGLGELRVDVAYGGNFYAIIEAQNGYKDFRDYEVQELLRWSPVIRKRLNEQLKVVHPEDPTIQGISHVQWTGPARHSEADASNAVFYGNNAIDRSPCGTGTSARMAQLAARNMLGEEDQFVHESIIGSLFKGNVLGQTKVGEHNAIIPQIEGRAKVIGLNTRFVDDEDPISFGFQVR